MQTEVDPYAVEKARVARGAKATKLSAISLGAGFLSILLPVTAPVPAVIYFALLLTVVGVGFGATAVVMGHRYWTPILIGALGFTLSLMFPVLLVLSILRTGHA